MIGPVDLLAVLDRYSVRVAEDGCIPPDLYAARAAVAELIEAANRARGIIAIHGDRCPQLEAALANVGPQS